MAQFGEDVWFRKIGEDGVTSFACRMIQGVFVGHHDRTGAVLCITKDGVVWSKSWTRETLHDAWDATNWDDLCGIPWQMVTMDFESIRCIRSIRRIKCLKVSCRRSEHDE